MNKQSSQGRYFCSCISISANAMRNATPARALCVCHALPPMMAQAHQLKHWEQTKWLFSETPDYYTVYPKELNNIHFHNAKPQILYSCSISPLVHVCLLMLVITYLFHNKCLHSLADRNTGLTCFTINACVAWQTDTLISVDVIFTWCLMKTWMAQTVIDINVA